MKLCGLPEKFLWHKAITDSSSSSNSSSSKDRLALNSTNTAGTRSLCKTPGNSSSSCNSSGGTGGSSGGAGSSTNMSSSGGCDGSGISSTNHVSSSSSKSPGGVLQGSSSEAVLVAMLAARARALAGQAPETAVKLVAYGTEQVSHLFWVHFMCIQ